MGWLFAIAVLILLVVSAGFRKFAAIIVALAAIGGGIYYLYDQRQEKLSKTRIPASQVAISGGRINLQYGTYHFSGRITNNSQKFTLAQVELAVTVRDCVPNSTPRSCVTIGDTRETLYINVPPGQARDFDESLYFPGKKLAPNGELEWQYKISQTRASSADA